MDLGIRQVLGEGPSTLGSEDPVSSAPDCEEWHLSAAKILVDRGVEGRVGCVVTEQSQLDAVVAFALQLRVVEDPGVGINQVRLGHAGEVLPADGFGLERSANGGLSLGA